jgi:hypothetical protein
MTTRRLYVENANNHAILNGAVLQGLGADKILSHWPKGRSYNDIATFRAPYTTSYFQDGSLLGLGAAQAPGLGERQLLAIHIASNAPPNLKRYLLSGEPMPALANNVALPTNQIPRWAYAVMAVGAGALGYVSYKRFKKSGG